MYTYIRLKIVIKHHLLTWNIPEKKNIKNSSLLTIRRILRKSVFCFAAVSLLRGGGGEREKQKYEIIVLRELQLSVLCSTEWEKIIFSSSWRVPKGDFRENRFCFCAVFLVLACAATAAIMRCVACDSFMIFYKLSLLSPALASPFRSTPVISYVDVNFDLGKWKKNSPWLKQSFASLSFFFLPETSPSPNHQIETDFSLFSYFF